MGIVLAWYPTKNTKEYVANDESYMYTYKDSPSLVVQHSISP